MAQLAQCRSGGVQWPKWHSSRRWTAIASCWEVRGRSTTQTASLFYFYCNTYCAVGVPAPYMCTQGSDPGYHVGALMFVEGSKD